MLIGTNMSKHNETLQIVQATLYQGICKGLRNMTSLCWGRIEFRAKAQLCIKMTLNTAGQLLSTVLTLVRHCHDHNLLCSNTEYRIQSS